LPQQVATDICTQGKVLTAKWDSETMNWKVPWQILVHHRIQSATHLNGKIGTYSLCDRGGEAEDFKIPASIVLRRI
jgi:hypothetical protein